MNNLLRKCHAVTAAALILSATSCALAQSMPPILEDGFGGPSGNVLWDSATDGFTGIRNEPGVSTTSIEFDATVGMNVYRMEYTGGGQNDFGGIIYGSQLTPIKNAIADAGQINVRYLVRFGTATGQNEWAGSWYDGGFELKAFDIYTGNTSTRIIMMIRPAHSNSSGNDPSRGDVVLRIDGTRGEREVETLPVSGWTYCFDSSGVWYYLEVQINSDGSVQHWYAPYDGSGTEYTQGSPNISQSSVHSYNFEWMRDVVHLDFGYRNHDSYGNPNRIDARLTISNSFIGPE